jgi:hypothetical protein
MSFDADVRRIMRLGLDSSAKLVLLSVRLHGDECALCRVTVEKLVEMTALGRATVFRHLGDLVDSGNLIRVEKGAYRLADSLMVRRSPSHGETVAHVAPSHGETVAHVAPSHGETVMVSQRDSDRLMVRPPPTPPYDVLSGLDMKTTSSHAPERAHTREETPPAPAPTRRKLSPVEDVIRGHPLADTLRPYVEACLAIVGTVPDVFTVESWHARGYSLARVRFGLGQARQVMGQNVPVGRVIVSAGNWMSRAERHEYAHLEPKPAETAPSRPPQVEMTAEERAAALARLDAIFGDEPRKEGLREGCA